MSRLRFVFTSASIRDTKIIPNVQLLKEQNKYDQIPLGLLNRLRRVLPLANKVADEIICEETDILEEILPRMFKVMQKVAGYSCDYVRRGRLCRQLTFLDFGCADDCSENGSWAGRRGNDQRNGEGPDRGD